MSLTDLVLTPRKVLLLDSEDPNKSNYCSHADYIVGEDCPYLKITLATDIDRGFHINCMRYSTPLRLDKHNELIQRCTKCEKERFPQSTT